MALSPVRGSASEYDNGIHLANLRALAKKSRACGPAAGKPQAATDGYANDGNLAAAAAARPTAESLPPAP